MGRKKTSFPHLAAKVYIDLPYDASSLLAVIYGYSRQ